MNEPTESDHELLRRQIADAMEDLRDGVADAPSLVILRERLATDAVARQAYLAMNTEILDLHVALGGAACPDVLPHQVASVGAAIRDGSSDREAVMRYFALAQPKLRAYIRSLVYNASDVDDILQDIAVVAIERAETFDPSRPVGAWVFGIARIRVMQYCDKAARQSRRFSGDLMDAISAVALEDEGAAESLDVLQGCLQKIAPEQREILVRRHLPGVTSRQLAQELGYSDSRMSRWLNRVYESLMKCVQSDHLPDGVTT